MAYGTVNADVIRTSVAGSNLGAGNASIMKNRIINGAMNIAQYGTGSTSVQTGSSYVSCDRYTLNASQNSKFTIQQNAGSVTPPAGFSNYLGMTSSSAYSITSTDYFLVSQKIEGFNFADFNWGTANAKTVTLSFQVYSSLTGTFGGCLRNSANNRFYPYSYTVSSANTWTPISVTIAGDTTGTWVGATNGTGVEVMWSLGTGSTYSQTAGSWTSSTGLSATGATSVVGTSGATFYITGVQLEVGSSATGFEYRQYGTELALCQRYYWRSNGANNSYPSIYGNTFGATAVFGIAVPFPVPMRTSPTVNKNGTWTLSGCGQPVAYNPDNNGFTLYVVGTGGNNVIASPNGATTYIDTSGAEL